VQCDWPLGQAILFIENLLFTVNRSFETDVKDIRALAQFLLPVHFISKGHQKIKHIILSVADIRNESWSSRDRIARSMCRGQPLAAQMMR
jgi:hypothetical protein